MTEYANMSLEELDIECETNGLTLYWTGVRNRRRAVRDAILDLAEHLDAEGWVLVPKEPTPEMIGSWYRYKSGFHYRDEPLPRDTCDYGAYRSMLSAAPACAEVG